MPPLIRPVLLLPSAPEKYDQRDQAELRRELQKMLDSLTVVTGNPSVSLAAEFGTLPAASSVVGTDKFVNMTSAGVVQTSTATILRTFVLGISGGVAILPEALTIGGNLLSDTTATDDIGATGTRWKDGWFSGTLTATSLAGTLTTAAQGNVTSLGTLTALAIGAGSTTNALTVTTTGAIQGSFRYDGSNRLDVAVGSTGITSLTPVGAAARVTIGLLTLTPTDMVYVGGPWVVEHTVGAQLVARYSTSSGLNAGVTVDSSGNVVFGPSGSVNDKNLTLKYRVAIIDESGSVSLSDAVALYLPAGTTTLAPIRFAPGVAPSSPGDGDTWNDGSTLRFREAGANQYASWTRQGTISDPSGGGVQDAEARTAIASIIDALQATNIIA